MFWNPVCWGARDCPYIAYPLLNKLCGGGYLEHHILKPLNTMLQRLFSAGHNIEKELHM
jgi:hypothetical protein